MRTIFDLIANEWKPWFRKYKWLPGNEQQTWTPWFSFLRVLFGLKPTKGDFELFQACTGRTVRLPAVSPRRGSAVVADPASPGCWR
jgi:hypothetical protein